MISLTLSPRAPSGENGLVNEVKFYCTLFQRFVSTNEMGSYSYVAVPVRYLSLLGYLHHFGIGLAQNVEHAKLQKHALARETRNGSPNHLSL